MTSGRKTGRSIFWHGEDMVLVNEDRDSGGNIALGVREPLPPEERL